jgi:hypothetical protein
MPAASISKERNKRNYQKFGAYFIDLTSVQHYHFTAPDEVRLYMDNGMWIDLTNSNHVDKLKQILRSE